MEDFDKIFVLTRVLTSGVIMSIERNEKELAGLEGLVRKWTGKPFVSLFNSTSGAIHGALWGQGICFGDKIARSTDNVRQQNFIKWLGIKIDENAKNDKPLYQYLECTSHSDFQNSATYKMPIVCDFTGLGFGPVAATTFNNEIEWKKAERLKIFGAFDLRTMWTQEESCEEIDPAIQFNYRLSPLVAACVRLSLMKTSSEMGV